MRPRSSFITPTLLDAGVRILDYPAMLHAKAFVRDGEELLAGTCNLEAWSLKRFFEIDVQVRSTAVARQFDERFSEPAEATSTPGRRLTGRRSASGRERSQPSHRCSEIRNAGTGRAPPNREDTVRSMTRTFEEREVLEEAADRWWVFLVSGIAWLVFALLVFQWNYTTVYAISILFGVIALAAAANEFVVISVSTTGWKLVHAVMGVLFVIAGLWALVHPHNAFATLAALVGFFLLFKGIFDITVAFLTKAQFESGGSTS